MSVATAFYAFLNVLALTVKRSSSENRRGSNRAIVHHRQ